MPADPSLLPPYHHSPLPALGLLGLRPPGGDRMPSRPQNLAGFVKALRDFAEADEGYLLRSDGPGSYAIWVALGESLADAPTVSFPEPLAAVSIAVETPEGERPAIAVPLESGTFGRLVLLLLTRRPARLRAQALEGLADRAAFLLTLVENRFLEARVSSLVESADLFSGIALSGVASEEDLTALLEEALTKLTVAESVWRGQAEGGTVRGATVFGEDAFPKPDQLLSAVSGRRVGVLGPSLLVTAGRFGARTVLWAFHGPVAPMAADLADRLLATAEETFRRHRTEGGLREAIDRVTVLYGLERELAQEDRPEPCVRRTLEELTVASGAHAAALCLLEDNELVLAGHIGVSRSSEEELMRSKSLREHLLGLRNDARPCTLFADDLPEDLARTARACRLRTLFVIPIQLGGEAVGVAWLGFQEECVLEESLQEHLQAIAAIGAQAYSRQKLARERAHLLHSYRALSAVTDVALSRLPLDELLTELGRRLSDILAPDAVVIFLKDKPHDTVLRPVCKEGVVAFLSDDDLLLPLADVEGLLRDPYTVFEPGGAVPAALYHAYGRVVAAPVRTADRLLGVVRLDFPVGRRLRDAELRVLQVATERLSYVVEMRDLAQGYRDLYTSSILTLAGAVDAKDPYIRDHSEQVSKYARAIAEAMRLPPDEVEQITTAGLLHDVGKIAVPDQILNKPGKLTPEEYEIVKTHAEHGARIVEQGPALRHLAPIIRYHHERPDGQGYFRLSGTTAPLGAYIIAVADAFDTMTTDRPYRPALSVEAAIAELHRHRGTQFLPEVVDAFTDLYRRGRLPLRSA